MTSRHQPERAYGGIPTRTGPDGKLTTWELLVFLEAVQRRPGPLRLGPRTRQHDDQRRIRARPDYPSQGRQTIVVPAGLPDVTPIPEEGADLKPCEQMFMIATKRPGGTLAVSRVTVGKAEVNPSM